MLEKMKNEWADFKLLTRNIPSIILALFVVSVVCMNLLANKELNLGFIVTDCGICVSWLVFLTMDMLTKRYGPKPTIRISIFAICVSLCFSIIFFLISLIPSNWAMAYDLGDIANVALNATFGGTWYVILGSAFAFVVSAIVNAVLNWAIGKTREKDNFVSYALRTYISTALGQFTDNFVFALVVSHTFFGWTLGQCVIAAITTGVVELVCEIIFSPIGYKVCKEWQEENVGKEYLKIHPVD